MNWEQIFNQQWMGLLVALVSIAITVYIYKKQNKIKRLSYEILYSASLIDVNKDVINDLKITYKDQKVEQLNVIEVKIVNDGQIPIKKSDFEKPIEIFFKNSSALFDIIISNRFPLNLEVELDAAERKILINPLLLNPKDYFTLRISLDGKDRELEVSGRVEGISQINKININSIGRTRKILQFSSLLLVLFTMLLTTMLYYSNQNSPLYELLNSIIKFTPYILISILVYEFMLKFSGRK
jgi:hypothetical protein